MARFLAIETGFILARFLVSPRVITLGFFIVGGALGVWGFESLHVRFLVWVWGSRGLWRLARFHSSFPVIYIWFNLSKPDHICIIGPGWFCVEVCLGLDFLENASLEVYDALAISVGFSELILPLFEIGGKILYWLPRLLAGFSILLMGIIRNGIRVGDFLQAEIKKFFPWWVMFELSSMGIPVIE